MSIDLQAKVRAGQVEEELRVQGACWRLGRGNPGQMDLVTCMQGGAKRETSES